MYKAEKLDTFNNILLQFKNHFGTILSVARIMKRYYTYALRLHQGGETDGKH